MDTRLTAVIITRNEEDNIGRCLSSLDGVVDETIVIDSFSDDDTLKICQQFARVRVVQREWQGYSSAKNYGHELAATDYILSIDADEALSPLLRESITSLKTEGFGGKAYKVKRLNHYCGAWIYWGEWYPDTKIRIFNKTMARWEGVVHEKLMHRHQQLTLLKGDLFHFSIRSIRQHIDKSLVYSRLIAAQDVSKNKLRFLVYHGLLKPHYYFLKSYFFKFGFLDGSRGLIIAIIISWERFLRYVFFLEQKWSSRNNGPQ